MSYRIRKVRALSLLVAGATAAAVVVVPIVTFGTAATAATGCQVTYTTNTWSTGFTASLHVANLGSPINGWTLAFTFPGNQRITQGWSANWTQAAGTEQVTATNLSWNAQLGSTDIGFNGSYSGTNANPTSFTLNGVACTGTVTTPPTTTPPPTIPPGGSAPALHVAGNKIVTAAGSNWFAHGVNRSGGEFGCIQGNGIWNGPMDQASVTAIKSWNVNAVRLPLNEECWLATSDVQSQFGGAIYQSAVKDYVNLLVQNGITPILDLHWTYGQYTGNSAGCSDVKATCQKPMPDTQYSIPFWQSVAQTFKGNQAVVFDLFNEPYAERAVGNVDQGWNCWRDGGSACSPGISYGVAGMQALVNAVRGAGANNVIALGGLAYSNDMRQWLAHKPTDPANNLVAAHHSYNFNTCSNTGCWESQLAPVVAQVPMLVGELGENDCAHGYIDGLLAWLDQHQTGYLAWTWNAWDCSLGPALIVDYSGTPTAFGQGYKAHIAGR